MTGEALSPAQSARVTQNSGETPAQVIADVLNAAFDAIWFSADMVTSDLLSALDRAGYVIVPTPTGRTPQECLNYADALEGALRMLDDEDSAQKLAVLADQWRAEAALSAGSVPTRKDAND